MFLITVSTPNDLTSRPFKTEHIFKYTNYRKITKRQILTEVKVKPFLLEVQIDAIADTTLSTTRARHETKFNIPHSNICRTSLMVGRLEGSSVQHKHEVPVLVIDVIIPFPMWPHLIMDAFYHPKFRASPNMNIWQAFHIVCEFLTERTHTHCPRT
jgi:hypothetical protein